MARHANGYIFVDEPPRHRVRRFFLGLLLVLLALAALLAAYNAVISREVSLETEQITAVNLPQDLENWSILHISDLHGARLGEKQRAVASALGEKRYSTVVFTGDMLGPECELEPFLDLVALMPRDTPKFYIPGDTDPEYLDYAAHASVSPYADWAVRLTEAGVTILDEPVRVERGKHHIWYVPEYLYTLNLDTMENTCRRQLTELESRGDSLTADQAAQRRALNYEVERIGRIREAEKEITASDVQIVLTHTPITPEYMTEILNWRGRSDGFSIRYASLILAGHYAGGQWRIPGRGPVYVPEKGWFPGDEGISGMNYLMGIPQYISPGLGDSEIYPMPGRLLNHPTVTILYLTNRNT